MVNKEKNFISAVVYVNNNEKEIEKFITEINNVLNENFKKYEIICVNDASTDNSVEKIKEATSKIENASISIVNMSFFQGKEMAMNAGVDIAIGDFVYEFDKVIIDYDISTIMEVYNKSLQGYDIVNAASNKKRRKSSAIFYKVFNKFSNNQYEINTETFRILSRRAINRVQATNKIIPYRKAIYANCGLKLTNIYYISSIDKKDKINKQGQKEREQNAVNSLILFTDISYKFSIAMSSIMMIITIIVAIYTIYIFASSNPVQGWTTTMLFLSFVSFCIFAIFAIIIKYLSIIVDLIFKKTKYIVESIDKIN